MGKKGQHLTQPASALQTIQQILGLVPHEGLKDDLKDAIFVCIDCEAFEHSQDKVTEIGVAVLDTRDVTGLTAESPRDAWLSNLKYAHYRPVEYARLVNGNFIKGCPENFNFDVTTWIKLRDASYLMKRLFSNPARVADAADFSIDIPNGGRNIIFIAHAASNDKEYLRSVGFSMESVSGLVRTMDTQVLCGGSKKKPVALRRLLLSLGVAPVNLHNAGNDAAYTLQAVILMMLKDHAKPGSVPADLVQFAGKLPPAVYDKNKAPEVWAGTAEKEPLEKKDNAKIHPASSHRRGVLPKVFFADQRRRRKDAFRAHPDERTDNTADASDRESYSLGTGARFGGATSASFPDAGPSTVTAKKGAYYRRLRLDAQAPTRDDQPGSTSNGG